MSDNDLCVELNRLKNEVESLRNQLDQKKREKSDRECQTDEELVYNYAWQKYYHYFSSLNEKEDKDSNKTLKETAEEILVENGLVYDNNLKLYFDKNKNLHYDPNSGLYFDYDKGIYYKYENTQLSFHSQLDSSVWNRIKQKSGIIEFDDNEEESKDADELASKYPPCMRCIVEESDEFDHGKLFIVPFTGGSIGCGNECLIQINDNSINACITYDNEKKQYFLKNESNSSEIFLNNNNLPSNESSPIQHGDKLKLSKTILNLHIHGGLNTCNNCEPGIVAVKLASKPKEKLVSSDKQRRETVKEIKKKYGLCKVDYKNLVDRDYNDRAKERRQKIENDTMMINQVKQVSNANRPLNEANIGFKLLSKMGWKEGSGIGKSESGIREPIQAKIRLTNVGLGYLEEGTKAIDMSVDTNKKDKIKKLNWNKTMQRYKQVSIQTPTHSAFNQTSNEDDIFE